MIIWPGPKVNYMVKNSENVKAGRDKESPVQSDPLILQMRVMRPSGFLSALLGTDGQTV